MYSTNLRQESTLLQTRRHKESTMIYQAIAEAQARIIDELSALCKQLISELSQYKNCDEEEKRLKKLEDPTDGT